MFVMAFVATSSSSLCAAAACCVGYGIEEGNVHIETKCALPGYSQPHPGDHQPIESQEEHRVRLEGGNSNSGLPRNKGFAQVPPRAAPAEHQPHGPSMTPMEMCHQLSGSPPGIRGIVSRQGRLPMLCRKSAFWYCTGLYIIECLGEEPKRVKRGTWVI